MRFREHSELGWLMLQLLGALCMRAVTRDALALALQKPLMAGRKHGKASVMADSDMADAMAYAAGLSMCKRCGISLYFGACMQCDVGPPKEPATFTYDGQESLWWLSYADATRCAGVAIVQVTGEQTATRAAEAARALGIAPEGNWEALGIQMPEEERALKQRFAGRFLTIEEATREFAAQSIKSFEAENPDVTLDLRGLSLAGGAVGVTNG